MANDNSNVNVAIKTSYDGKGVESAKRGMAQAGNVAERFSRSAEQVQSSLSALSGVAMMVNPRLAGIIQITGAITNGIKGLGVALKALLKSPVALVIIAIAGAFMYWKKCCDDAKKAFVELYEKLQKGCADAIRDRNREVARSYQAIANAVENATDKLQHLNEIEAMRTNNKRAIEDSKGQLDKTKELSSATTAEERMVIEHKYQKSDLDREMNRKREDIQTQADNVLKAAQTAFADKKILLKGNQNEQVVLGRMIHNENVAKNREKDKEKKKEYDAKIESLNEQLKNAKDKEVAIKNEMMKADRELKQATETRKEILKGLTAVESEAKAKQAELTRTQEEARKALQKQRESAERNQYATNSALFDGQAESDREIAWRKTFEREDRDGKLAMLNDKFTGASKDESAAKTAIENLTEKLDGLTDDDARADVEKQLNEERTKYTKAANDRRAAEGMLDAFNKRDDGGFVSGIKLSDRISSMGGFSTKGAMAASGITFNTPEKQMEVETKKQSEYQKELRDTAKSIARKLERQETAQSSNDSATFQ